MTDVILPAASFCRAVSPRKQKEPFTASLTFLLRSASIGKGEKKKGVGLPGWDCAGPVKKRNPAPAVFSEGDLRRGNCELVQRELSQPQRASRLSAESQSSTIASL